MTNSTTMDDLKSTANQAADQAKHTANKVGNEAKHTASKVSDEVTSGSSVIGNEVKNFISDLEEMVTAKTSGAVDVSKIKNDITSRIADYKAQAKAAGEQALSQAKQQAEGVNTYVHEDPWKVIGASFAVGLLLGVVISRR